MAILKFNNQTILLLLFLAPLPIVAQSSYKAYATSNSALAWDDAKATWYRVEDGTVLDSAAKLKINKNGILYLYGNDGSMRLITTPGLYVASTIPKHRVNSYAKKILDSIMPILGSQFYFWSTYDTTTSRPPYRFYKRSSADKEPDALMLDEDRHYIFDDTLILRWANPSDIGKSISIIDNFEDEIANFPLTDTLLILNCREFGKKFKLVIGDGDTYEFWRLDDVQSEKVFYDLYVLDTGIPDNYPLKYLIITYYFKLRNLEPEYMFRLGHTPDANSKDPSDVLHWKIYKWRSFGVMK